MITETLSFSLAHGIARLTLNRPDAGNAVDFDLARALAAAAVRCDSDPAIRAVVLTGAGRLFCAGGDARLFASAGDRAGELLSELADILHRAVARFARMRKPMVTLVNGPAAGAGLSLALCADVVLAARSAHFTAAYGAIGLTPDGGMTWLLPRLVGLRRAQEILITNRRIAASEAETMGLVTRAVDDTALESEGARVAEALAQAATGAVGATRALLLESFDNGLEVQLEKEARAIAAAGAGPECREGLAAFLGKRKPDFQGV